MTAIVTAADLATLRADAESLMVDECTITRPDPSDFAGAPLTVYAGKCQFTLLGRTARQSEEPSGEVSDEHRTQVEIPAASALVKFNDKVTCTVSTYGTVPVGFDVYVRDIPTMSVAVKMRLTCLRSIR